MGRRHPSAPGVIPAEVKFHNADPEWGNNQAHRINMQDLQELIITGIKEAVPKSQNLNKVFEVHQKKDESPSEFLERMRVSFRKYSGLDPQDPLARGCGKCSL